MAGRICPSKGCPTIIPAGTARCAPCTKLHEQARGNTTQRGYGTAHQTARRKWATRLAQAGQLPCARCGKPIHNGQPFHLDHDNTRNTYLGIAHPRCNITAGGNQAAKLQTKFQ